MASSSSSFSAKDYPVQYLVASALAATINYPLWRASAIGQSGFRVSTTSLAGFGTIPRSISPYIYAFQPPYKGLVLVVSGMTWARAFIFWGSDRAKEILKHENENGQKIPPAVVQVVPPLVTSVIAQAINMPIVRASITLQNPQCTMPDTWTAVRDIYRRHGIGGLYHGLSAGLLKTVPKYCTAIIIKDYMEHVLPHNNDTSSPSYHTDRLTRSAIKSVVAGVAGAALTNPLDVIRNEMFKTNQSLMKTIQSLHAELGYSFLARGMGKNLVAVAIPVSCTIFFTDALIQWTNHNRHEKSKN